MKKTLSLILFLIAFIINMNAQTSAYNKLYDKIHIDGELAWDYLTADTMHNRLFVANSTQVHVIDTKINKKIGTIPNTKGVHGIALAYDLNKGYTSNGSDTSVTIFNLTTLSTIKKIKVTGAKPDVIIYDHFSHKVFTFNGTGKNATVINANVDTVLATIALNGKPEGATTDNNGNVYVNVNDSNIIKVISSTSHLVTKRYALGTGTGPMALAIDVVNHRLFSTCSNNIMAVVNYDDGSFITSVAISSSIDGIAYDYNLNRIYCSSGSGLMNVIQENTLNFLVPIENTITQAGAGTIAVNPVTHHIYLSCAEYEPPRKLTPKNMRLHPSPRPSSFTILDFLPY